MKTLLITIIAMLSLCAIAPAASTTQPTVRVRDCDAKADTAVTVANNAQLYSSALPKHWTLSYDFGKAVKANFKVDSAAPQEYWSAPYCPVGHDTPLVLTPGKHTIALVVNGVLGPSLTFNLANAPPSTQAIIAASQPSLKTLYFSANGNDSAVGSLQFPLRTLVVTGSKSAILLERGGLYFVPGLNLSNLTDVTIDCYGDSAKPLPVLFIAPNSNAISASDSTARVLIQNVRVDSTWTPATTAGGYAYHQPSAIFGNIRGQDWTFRNVELANLGEGIVLASAQRVTIDRLVQVDPLGMPARCLMITNVTDLTVTNSVFTNSTNESSLRATDKGFTRALFKGNKFGQLLDPAHDRALAKAAVTLRQGVDLTWIDNDVVNGELSINTDITGQQTITNCLLQGGSITGSHLTIRPGARNVTVRGMKIDGGTGECVSDSSDVGAGIVYDGLILTGSNCGIKSYGPGNFVYRNIVWNSTGGADKPVAKGDLSAAVSGK